MNKSGFPIERACARTVFYSSKVNAFFGGKQLRVKRPIGVDFENEKIELTKLPFIEGSLEKMFTPEGKNGIIIGTAISKPLKARVGDDIVISVVTDAGQYNTGTFVIQGIFDEVNVFGYAVYMHIETLNDLIQVQPGAATEIAVYAKPGVNLTKFSEKLRLYLEKAYPVYPPITSRAQYGSIRGDYDEYPETLAVISIEAQLDEIKTMLNAFLIATYFVLCIFLLIIMVGITNTFRVLINNRVKEIGTLRVLGMQIGEVRNLFLFEAILLAIFASFAGFLLGFVILYASSLFNLQSITIANMFLENGKLAFYLDIKLILLNLFFIVITVIIAVFRPAIQASRVPAAEALRSL